MDSTAPVLFDLNHASFCAGKAMLVRDVNLRVGPGEFIGVLGPNGAGKSTLLGLMNLTLRPTGGEIAVFGTNPWSESESTRARLRGRIGSVLQRADFQHIAPLTAFETAAIGRMGAAGGLAGRLRAEDMSLIEGAMERAGCAHLARRAYRSLSGGEQQKVQLARALAQRPEALLLDEPTAGLDIDWQERIIALIEDLSRREGLAIVMTTHALGHLPAGCGRVILLRDGRIVADGPAGEILQSGPLSELHGCPVEVAERGGRRFCVGAKVVES